MHPETGGRVRGLNAGVSRADHDDVKPHLRCDLLADTEARKDVLEQFVGRPLAGDFFERRPGLLQVGEQEFLRRRLLLGCGPSSSNQAGLRALDQRDVAHVRKAGPVGEQIDVQRPEDLLSQSLQPESDWSCHPNGIVSLPRRRQIRLARNQEQPFYIR